MKKSGTKRILFVALFLFVLVGAGILSLYTKDYSHHFARQRGTFSRASLSLSGDSLQEKSWLTIYSTNGFKVDCGILVPRERNRRYPALVMLGGKTTGKYAIDYAVGVSNCIIVAVDYAYEPREEYSVLQFLADVPEIRRALLDVVPSAMLVTDYLRTRNDVDTMRIVLLGYSFGAPFVPCVIAHDRRPAAAVMVYGAGGLRTLIRHNVNRYRGRIASEFVGTLGGLLLRPIEPMRYIEQVSPKPLLMLNGTEDELIPQGNVTSLFAKAREPKKIVWLESRHVRLENPELTRKIITHLQHELQTLGIFNVE